MQLNCIKNLARSFHEIHNMILCRGFFTYIKIFNLFECWDIIGVKIDSKGNGDI